ncbi:hypothetical protein [Paludisphaera sp.]|uniref:hypothetical protein n=1 Tax=Paludisphaera sp. TaxID=2017432 RepID=UPI00301DC2B7
MPRSLKRIATVGCLLLAGLLSGCGGEAAPEGPVAEDRPDAGLEASKSIMQMQPPMTNKKGNR